MSTIGSVLHGGRARLADLELMRDKLFYARRDQRDAPVKFRVLLGLSTVIAGGGVIGDSTATVIGASANVAQNLRLESAAQQAATDWVAGTGHELTSVTTKGDLVTVVIADQGKVPEAQLLEAAVHTRHPAPR